jgi:ABC-type glycerol-3-phosphate transport system substrate-binding protein
MCFFKIYKKEFNMRTVAKYAFSLLSLFLVAGFGFAQTKLTVACWWMNDPVRAANMQTAIVEFQKLYPKVQVEALILDGTKYWDKLYLDIANDSEADIVAVDTGAGISSYDQTRPGGAFLALDKYIKGYVLKDGTSLEKDILFLNATQRSGQTIALPFINFYAQNTVYRKSVLKAAGIDPKKLETWSGQLEVAKALTKADASGKRTTFGFAHPTTAKDVLTRWFTMPYLWTAGGGIFPLEKGPYTPDRLIFNSKENIKAFEYLLSINKAAGPTGDRRYYDDIRPLFLTGDVAFMQAAIWTMSSIETDMMPAGAFTSDLAFAPFPTYDLDGQKRAPIYESWGNPLAISSKSKHPKEAFDFIAYMHSIEVQKREGVAASPVNKKALPFYNSVKPKQGEFVAMATKYEMRIVPDIPQWNEFEGVIRQTFNSILVGAQTPKEALDEGQAEMVKILQAKKK